MQSVTLFATFRNGKVSEKNNMISIITPSHDTKFLKELEATILSQSFSNWEWIVLPNKGAKYEANDDRIRIMEVEISNKYKPLFTLFQDNQHKDVDTVIITGGRYSLKSYTVSIFALPHSFTTAGMYYIPASQICQSLTVLSLS